MLLRRWGITHAAKRPYSGPILQAVEFPVRYFRTAHAYILISKPTAISTIFGVFQVISLPPWGWTVVYLLMQRKENARTGSSQSGRNPSPNCAAIGSGEARRKAFDVGPIRTRPQNFVIAILVVEAGAVTH
jgi:hypothetical protein